MEELTRIRNERGWSQQRLADESDVNKATINQIERGRRSPNVETLEKLACALGVEIADFFPKAAPPLPFDSWDQPEARGTRSRGLVQKIEPAWRLEDALVKTGWQGWQKLLREMRIAEILREVEAGAKTEDEAIEAIANEIAQYLQASVETQERVVDG